VGPIVAHPPGIVRPIVDAPPWVGRRGGAAVYSRRWPRTIGPTRNIVYRAIDNVTGGIIVAP